VNERAIPEARELFALPPGEFVEARDRLAGELKTQGRSDEAAEVKKLRRPSLVAWAINAAARERPGEVSGLLDAGAELRRAQRKTLSGGGGKEMRQATAARRAMIRTLADAAIDAIGTRGTAHRDAISATLDAASVDPELGEQLRAGTLERESRPAAGFGAVEGFEVLVGGGTSEEDAGPSQDREADARERAREARAAGQRAVTAERAAEKAARRAHELRTKAAAAVSAARDAEAEAKRLSDEAKTERKRADRASKAADAAR
jgi:signal transduction histidine kinase